MNPFYLALELAAVVLFVVAALAAARRGRLPLLVLISAAIFGILLEEGDQLIYGTYRYAEDWVLVIDRAPVVIGLSWALILAGAMRITDAVGVRRRYASFVDALLAIGLDIALDPIATRMGLWTWFQIGQGDGWFGVPWGNYHAWLFVTLGFSLMTRWLRDVAAGRPTREWLQMAVPLPAYGILVAGIGAFGLLKPSVDPAPGGGAVLFVAALAPFLVASAWGVFGPDRVPPDGQGSAIIDLRLAFMTRAAIYGFYVAALLVMGLATSLPVLLAVSLVLLSAELPLAALVRLRLTDARDAGAAREAAAAAATMPYR